MSTNYFSPMNPHLLEKKLSLLERYGEVAPPNTWLSSYTVKKSNGKSYRYYRLMTTVRDEQGLLKRKMVRYLGGEDSQAYTDMVEAIERRNQIQALRRQLERLSPTIPKGNNSAPLTSLDRELLLSLQQQLDSLRQQFSLLQAELSLLKSGQLP
jgi:hypothetical protein